MRSKAALFGHPIHAMLVGVPIGLFSWTLAADFIYITTDDRVWYDISYYSGIAAVISALGAALPGFIDYLAVALKTSATGVATLHMAINLSIVFVYAAAAVVATDRGAIDGSGLVVMLALHLAGFGLLALSGWLGAELVYRHHIGMIPEAEPESTERIPGRSSRPAMR